MVQFDGNSFLVYQMLSNQDRVDFVYTAQQEGLKKAIEKYLLRYFSDWGRDGLEQVSLFAFMTQDRQKLNMFIHRGVVHLNCEKLRPIKRMVHTLFQEGEILYHLPEIRKTKHNRHKYHMRYYRAYVHVNSDERRKFPLCYS
jgi:hypothetical protein